MFGRKVIQIRRVLGQKKFTLSTLPHKSFLCKRHHVAVQIHDASPRLKNTLVIRTHQQMFRRIHITSALSKEATVVAPTYPESVSSGEVKLFKKEGDAVAMDEVLLEIETDKTALPVVCPGHGTITKVLVKQGEAVKSGQALLTVNVTSTVPTGAAPVDARIRGPGPPPGVAAPAAAPAAARLAAARPAAAAAPAASPVVTRTAATAHIAHSHGIITTTDPTKTISGTRSEHAVPINRMRLRIAERLKDAQNTAAMLTTFNEADMSKLMAFRKANLKTFVEKYGVKLSFMSPFLMAASNALKDQPIVNSVIHKTDIIYRDYVDISIAVATPRGLVVPVIRNVDTMDYPRLELEINAIANKAMSGKLMPADMQGGTFTVSNGGVFGSLLSTPIINLPQSAILGMHAIIPRPVAISGKVEIRPMMYLALTYDHRLIDGREAVLFLRKIKSGVEDPTSILAGI